MNRGRMIVLVMAVACAGLAMMLMRNMVNGPRTKIVSKEVSEINVLVAKADIAIGKRLTHRDLKWQPWPGSAAKGYITKRRDPQAIKKYSGSVARVAIGAGDPIRSKKLVKVGQGGVMAAILPSGVRAYSIKVSNEKRVSGLILPNDRVDIIVSAGGKRGKSGKWSSETILRSIRVLAVGSTLEGKEGQKTVKAKTITLALTPRQVEIVTHNKDNISLSLRSLADAEKSTPGLAPVVKTKAVATETSNVIKILKFGATSQVRVTSNIIDDRSVTVPSTNLAETAEPVNSQDNVKNRCQAAWGADTVQVKKCIERSVVAQSTIEQSDQ